MSVQRFVELTCDICSEAFPDHANYRIVREIREAARSQGWRITGKGDVCAYCAPGAKEVRNDRPSTNH